MNGDPENYRGYRPYVSYFLNKGASWDDVAEEYGYSAACGAHAAAKLAASRLGLPWPPREKRTSQLSLSELIYQHRLKNPDTTWEKCFIAVHPGVEVKGATGSIACNMAKSYATRRGLAWPLHGKFSRLQDQSPHTCPHQIIDQQQFDHTHLQTDSDRVDP